MKFTPTALNEPGVTFSFDVQAAFSDTSTGTKFGTDLETLNLNELPAHQHGTTTELAGGDRGAVGCGQRAVGDARDFEMVSEDYSQISFSGLGDTSVWNVPALVPARTDISGAWIFNGQWTQIRQMGDQLTLVDANGRVSTGNIAGDNAAITAPNFGTSGLTGTLNGSQIDWSDGTTWTRAVFAPPVLSHVWTVSVADPASNIHVAQIDPNGGELLLTNRAGAISRGILRSSTEIYAVNWQLVGTLSATDSVITWTTSTPTWTSAPSNIDSLFAADFNPFD